jgi:capsular polysaccharide transport system permease protein
MSVSAGRTESSLVSGILTQLRVVVALMIYEGQSDYSKETLGFFWVIGEPFVLTCGVILMWTLRGRDATHPGVSVEVMALTAYTHLNLWRRAVLGSLPILRQSGFLFFHRNISAADIVAAHVLIKGLATFTAFVVIYIFLVIFKVIYPARDLALTVTGFAFDVLFTLTFSIFMAGLCELNEIVEKVTHPLMYLTLPLSGAFFLTAWLPPQYRWINEYSPMANAVEMMRAGMFSLSIKTYYSVPVMALWSLLFLALGLPLIRYARLHLVVT